MNHILDEPLGEPPCAESAPSHLRTQYETFVAYVLGATCAIGLQAAAGAAAGALCSGR